MFNLIKLLTFLIGFAVIAALFIDGVLGQFDPTFDFMNTRCIFNAIFNYDAFNNADWCKQHGLF